MVRPHIYIYVALRSTAQLISYELVLSSVILLIVLLTNSLNLTVNIEVQKTVWFILPLLPMFIIFFIGAIAETNRAPFDLAEAESELVSGFMTEHSAVIFVFFFLAEYASIVLICTVTSLLFLGGYDMPSYIVTVTYDFIMLLYNSFAYLFDIHDHVYIYNYIPNFKYEGLKSSLAIAVKSLIMIFVFIWVRASFPRIRFDQLMSTCWTVLLPLIFGFIICIFCLLYVLGIMPNNLLF